MVVAVLGGAGLFTVQATISVGAAFNFPNPPLTSLVCCLPTNLPHA